MITQDELKERLDYDPQAGIFTWRVAPNRRIVCGSIAGYADNRGYVKIRIDGKNYFAHRLAWLWAHGEWPVDEIDHINGNPSENVISNLRLATRSENRRNTRTRSDSKIGLKGVTLHKKTGTFRACIGVNRKTKSLGYFSTQDDAHRAYCEAAQKYYGEFANEGGLK